MVANGSTLVLGGGGVAGIAWMTGLLAGLAEAGQDVTGADLVIGTSAGATVAAQLGGGLGLDELFARQVEPALQSRELMVELDLAKFGADIQPYMARAVSPDDMLGQFGRFALAAQTGPQAERRVGGARVPGPARGDHPGPGQRRARVARGHRGGPGALDPRRDRRARAGAGRT